MSLILLIPILEEKNRIKTMLFCLILIKKYGFCLQIIKEKIDEHLNGSKELSKIVYQVIVDLQLYCESFFQENYEFFKDIDLVSDNKFKIISSVEIEKNKENKSSSTFSRCKNITEDFYNGFKID